MARPRSNNKSPRKGGGTSFGKRSDAEKSFRKKPSSSRSDESDSKRSFGKPSGFRKSTGSFRSSDKPSSSSRPYSARPDQGSGEGFRRRSETGSGSYNKPRSDGDEKKPFRRNTSSAKPWEAGKRPYQRDNLEGAGKRPDRRDTGRTDRPEGFTRSPRKESGEGRPESRGFKKDYQKPEGYRARRETPDNTGEKPEGDFKKPVRKSGDFVKKDGDFRNQRDNKSFGKEERKSFVQSRVTTADFTRPDRKTKTVAAPVEEEKTSDGLTRLNKYIANSGVGSRRDADKLITMGLISVNGVTITELGSKVKSGDVVRYEDKILKAEKLVYILLNKPKGFITTTDDPQERSTVMGLVAGACKERIYPVGRLDRNTTGLLLLTNDGDLADKLTHPSYQAKKVYKVELDKPITKNDFQKIQEGVRLEEGRAMVDDVAIISDDNKTLGLEIHIGWNRVVRRIFETLGYVVVKLDRSVYAGLDKKDTPRGNWRFLKPEEIVMLKHFK